MPLSFSLGQRGTGSNPSKSDLPVAGQSRRLDGAIPLFSPPAKKEIDPGHRHVKDALHREVAGAVKFAVQVKFCLWQSEIPETDVAFFAIYPSDAI